MCVNAGEHISTDQVGHYGVFLPRVDGAGHSVVAAVVHGVWGPAVAAHTLRAVVSCYSQMLEGDSGEKRHMEKRLDRRRGDSTSRERRIESKVEGEGGVRRTRRIERKRWRR